MFGQMATNSKKPAGWIRLKSISSGRFELTSSFSGKAREVARQDLPALLMDVVVEGLVTDLQKGVAFHAGAVARGDQAILISGLTCAGKSVLTALLVEQGFEYLSDEVVIVDNTAGAGITTFGRALTLREDSLSALPDAGHLKELPRIEGSERFMIKVPVAATKDPIKLALMIFPQYEADSDLRLSPLSPAAAGLRLLQANLNGRNLVAGGLPITTRLAKATPAIALTYGHSSQLEGVLDRFINHVLDNQLSATACRHYFSAFLGSHSNEETAASTEASAIWPIQPATPSRGKFKLTIGMATYDDFDGVYFTIQSLRLNNPELMQDIEFLVYDNNPTGPCSKALKDLEKNCPTYRYIPYVGDAGTPMKYHIFSEARGDYVMVLDCHVLLMPGALPRLMAYFDAHPETSDLLQGPMMLDNLSGLHSHFNPVWSKGMFGRWGFDPRAKNIDSEPFEIDMQGLGLFVCRKDAWPGFNPNFRGFGAEEGYFHEKFRQAGACTLCLPFLRWLHRFPRPMGVPYTLNWQDRIRNYTIGYRELGLDEKPMQDHFREFLGETPMRKILAAIEHEMSNPFCHFEGIRCINLNGRADRRERMQKRFEKLGIQYRVSHLAAVETPENPIIGCTLSHRAAIYDAKQRGLKNVLVFEDDAIFHKNTMQVMPKIVEELETQDWQILFLGGCKWGKRFDLAPNCTTLEIVKNISTTHAIAYNHTIFDHLLEEWPEDVEGMKIWVETHKAIDIYFYNSTFKQLMTRPVLATQIELIPQEQPADQRSYTI